MLRENNNPSPLVLRTNTLKITRDELNASLQSEGALVTETTYSPVGLKIISSPGLRSLTAYQKGWFMVQDEAAQLITLIVSPRPGEKRARRRRSARGQGHAPRGTYGEPGGR